MRHTPALLFVVEVPGPFFEGSPLKGFIRRDDFLRGSHHVDAFVLCGGKSTGDDALAK